MRERKTAIKKPLSDGRIDSAVDQWANFDHRILNWLSIYGLIFVKSTPSSNEVEPPFVNKVFCFQLTFISNEVYMCFPASP